MNTEHLTEVVYTQRSELLHPGRFFLSMFRDLAASRELAWRLFVRDLSARYRQSLARLCLGFPSAAGDGSPICLFQIARIVYDRGYGIPYPAYVMIGMLFWQVFVDAVQCPLKAVTAAKPMLSKIQFPPEAILMAGLGRCFV